MRTPKIRTRPIFIAVLLSAAVAMPVFSDTLILHDGRTFSGTLVSATSSTVRFRNRTNGATLTYPVRDVDSVQFGDVPYQSRNSGSYNNNDRYNAADRYQGSDPRYDQTYMERVVVPAGAIVPVRTDQSIDVRDTATGQTFTARIDDDVRGVDGSIAIPRGADATLITRFIEGDGDITLDLDSISVNGRRYRVSTEDKEVDNPRDLGKNKRTGEFVGGGAVLGAIIGAIAGGGKGAAIGAASGAGAGVAAQVITRGKTVHVPAETVLRFRLDQPLRLRSWS